MSSIFIGNLPPHIPVEKVSGFLLDYLSKYEAVSSVKVVPTNTHGRYAFALCKNDEAAKDLLETLQTTPQEPFHGRVLRYEASRAHRTIRVSYRIPSRQDTPFALKLSRRDPSSRTTISFDDLAMNSEDTGVEATQKFHPLKFDAKLIQQLVEHFGPLESVDLYCGSSPIINGDGQRQFQSYPYPHNLPRSPHMDPRCWDIKYRVHDDCSEAFQTLKKLPFLSVTIVKPSLMTDHSRPSSLRQKSASEASPTTPNFLPTPPNEYSLGFPSLSYEVGQLQDGRRQGRITTDKDLGRVPNDNLHGHPFVVSRFKQGLGRAQETAVSWLPVGTEAQPSETAVRHANQTHSSPSLSKDPRVPFRNTGSEPTLNPQGHTANGSPSSPHSTSSNPSALPSTHFWPGPYMGYPSHIPHVPYPPHVIPPMGHPIHWPAGGHGQGYMPYHPYYPNTTYPQEPARAFQPHQPPVLSVGHFRDERGNLVPYYPQHMPIQPHLFGYAPSSKGENADPVGIAHEE
ncbi:hypothetical protein ONZ45_g1385 [Pleurotus djamor]|nr:hypothetical protein ONZ45_g1385 [Pleurotus djamor]